MSLRRTCCPPDYSYRTVNDRYTCDCGRRWRFDRGRVSQTLTHGPSLDGQWVRA